MSNDNPTDLLGQEEAQAQTKEQLQHAARQKVEDLKWLMSDKRGRRIVWDLLDRTGIYRTSFTGNSETFFREGQRNVGLYYVGELHQHCPKQYADMIKENQRND